MSQNSRRSLNVELWNTRLQAFRVLQELVRLLTATRIHPPGRVALLKHPGVADFQGVQAHSLWGQMEWVYDEVSKRALDMAFADADQQKRRRG